MQYFTSFLKAQHADENLTFWLETQKYARLKDKEEMKVMAKSIYKKFMKGSSETEVNLPSTFKNTFSQNMEKPDFQPDPNLFKSVSKEVYNLMQSGNELFCTSSKMIRAV